jgi:uncharacterized protein (TIGR00288 family)
MADQQVAVLIDFENVGLGSIQWLFDQISDVGRIIVRRAYADWSDMGKSDARNKRDQLLELGIEPIHLFQSASGKNASDIRLAIDAIDLLNLSPVDTFVIVSSDSDFVPLVSKLRAAGKTVIGAGRQAAASRTLVISCDRYLYLDQNERTPADRSSSKGPQAERLLTRAVKAAMDEQGRVVGSKLYQNLQRLDPSFDFRAMGYSTFTRYLEASTEVRVLRPGGRGEPVVELAELDTGPTNGPPDPEVWGPRIDDAWSQRAASPGQSIPGHAAASDAAKVLGARKLSESPYRTLQRLLNNSERLNARWSRDRSTIIRR